MIVQSEINLQNRSMYNTYPWLSRQFYGQKSVYYIRSFTVRQHAYFAGIEITALHLLQQTHDYVM